jgi:type I restriction enzyme S subunit
VLSFANGKTSPERSDGVGNPVYGSNGVIGFASETNSLQNTIVIGRVGSYCGSLYLSKGKCWVTDNAIRATALNDNDARFLFYLLRTLDLNHWRAGSGQPLLNQAILSQIPASIPLPDEQRAIAQTLGTLDDKIELNQRLSETLEAMAHALFKSWFVDFDPVRAKANGRDPGLPKPLADLFPDSLEDSDRLEIPKGWTVSKIGAEVDTVLGGTPSRAEPRYWGGDIPWINSGKANEFRIVEPSEFITKDGLDNSATKLLPSRTTVIAITGATLGQVSLTEIATCANQSIVGVIGKAELPSEFLYFWVRSRISDLLASQTGGAQQHINKNNVNDLAVLVPSDPIISAFIAQARPCFDRIKNCCLESRSLAAMRDALLPKLIYGELRVKDAKPLAQARA